MFQHVRAMALGLAVMFASTMASATSAAAADLRSGEVVSITGAFRDVVLAAGRNVRVGPAMSDDVLVVAQDVRIDALTGDHVLAGAKNLEMRSGELRDLVAAAGDIRLLSGQVTDDFIAAAGAIHIAPQFRIGGSVIAAGGEIDILGPVAGEAWLSGGAVRIDSAVAKSVKVTADRLILGPNARIGGDFTYSAGQVEISPSAVIVGRRIPQARPAPKPAAAPAAGDAFGAVLVFLVGGALLTAALGIVFPGVTDRMAARSGRQLAGSAALGLLVFCAAPAAIVLLAVTVVGIPLAIAALLLYLAATPLALGASVFTLGMRMRRLVRRGRAAPPPNEWARLLWAMAAIVVLAIAGSIPAIGFLVWLFAYLAGLGGLTMEIWNGRRRFPEAAETQGRPK